MYKSKDQVEKKLAQARFVLKEMQKYRGKVFVNNGVDEETGAYPLQVNISSFLAHTRSALQYAYKECKELDKRSVYEATINDFPLISVFRDLRNTDIHEMIIGTHTVISAKVEILKEGDEELEKSNKSPTQASIKNKLSRPVEITENLINKLRSEGRTNLVEAAESGKALYETVEYEGEQDLFILCERYISDIEVFSNKLQQLGVMN